MEKNKTIKDIQEWLGKPFRPDFSEYTRKVRNNLGIVSVLSIIIITQGIEVNGGSFLGLKFNEDAFKMILIYKILFYLNIYFFIHFIWLAWDNFLQWRIKLTGTFSKNENTFAGPNEVSDNREDPSQTTLYSWWVKESKGLCNTEEKITLLTKELKNISLLLEKKSTAELKKEYDILQRTIGELNTHYMQSLNTIKSNRIPASLERFDNYFNHMHNSQGYRWLILELLAPILIGVWAIILLYNIL